MFTTNYQEILQQIENINPIEYGKTRNYSNGAVTHLSPYISRGIISTKQIATSVISKGFKPFEIDSFLKELAWRDYFQQVWVHIGANINTDIKNTQPNVANNQISIALVNAKTGITAIDDAIVALQTNGYMHNHLRMYVASIACNIAQSHWLLPAKWMYYYLLDADWASNACSWQWVAASFSKKKYYANQDNINKYTNSYQKNTFLDVAYEAFESLPIPNELSNCTTLNVTTVLPPKKTIYVDTALPTFIYNFYNLDINWHSNKLGNRILLLEPSFFTQYPVCSSTIDFILALAKNIANIEIYVGEFGDLTKEYNLQNIYYKEHPTSIHYTGNKENREWMFKNVVGYYPSFFAYWKQCEKHINNL
jgi:deoxyribodipyrimidine photo-lyase